MLFQIASIIGWALFWCKEKSIVLSLLVFLSLILVSCCWWENYVDKKCEKPWLKLLSESKENLDKNSRHKTYLIISIWNMIFTFVLMLSIFYLENPSNSIVKELFINFTDAFTNHKIDISRDKRILEANLIENDELSYNSNAKIPIILLLIQIICSLLAYSTGKFICRVCMQLFSFSFPLALAAPITISIVTTFCRLRYKDVCIVSQIFGPFNYIYWYSELDFAQLDITLADYLLPSLCALSILSQLWITIHIWQPKTRRLAKTSELFVRLHYCPVFIDQSLMLNRRIISQNDEGNYKGDNKSISTLDDTLQEQDEHTVRIYACATMWHETPDEMMQMLKSIMRMDADQCARKQAKRWFKVGEKDVDYYEIESKF